MDFAKIPVFNLMRDKLSYLSEQQNVLSQNLANADTPNYRAKEIETPDFKSEFRSAAGRLEMATTSPAHIADAQGKGGKFRVIRARSSYETTPTQNNVVIEEQMMKMSQTQMEYQTVTNLYRKTIDLFRAALGRPG